MKYSNLLLYFTSLLLFSCINTTSLFSQTNEFDLCGLIEKYENGQVILLDVISRDTLANGKLIHGYFDLNGTIENYDGFCKPSMLMVKKDDGRGSLSFPIALEPENTICSFDDNGPVFAGTENQQKLSRFIKNISSYEGVLKDTLINNKDSIISELASEVNIFLKENQNAALKHFAVLLAADFIQRGIVNPVDIKFDENICTSDTKTMFETMLCTTVKQAKEGWIGKDAPAFSSNSDEKQFDLKEIIGEKYILVDFWASWCKPCKDQLEMLKSIDLDKNKNLEIITVSIDSNKEAWNKNMEQLNPEWTNLIDFDRSIRKLYGVYAIPLTILIDENGKIIARNPENLLKLIGSLK